MFLSAFDRRRIVLIALVTLFALPSLWIVSRNKAAPDSSSVTSIGISDSVDTATASAASDGSLEPIILGGPAPIVQDGSARIAYPATDPTGVQAIASFSNFDGAPDIVCYIPVAPLGISITVKNLNNGRTTRCTNVYRISLPTGVTMLLHTNVFESLANLVDAPIPVSVSW